MTIRSQGRKTNSNREKKEKKMWKNVLEGYIGKAVAVWCVRYTYRGILEAVGEEVLTLKNPTAVEVTGAAGASTPKNEDPIPSDLHIALDAIEIVCIPSWANAQINRSGQ